MKRYCYHVFYCTKLKNGDTAYGSCVIHDNTKTISCQFIQKINTEICNDLDLDEVIIANIIPLGKEQKQW